MASAYRRPREAANLNKGEAFAGGENRYHNGLTSTFLSSSRRISRFGSVRILFLAVVLISVLVTWIHFVQFTHPIWLSRTLNEKFYNKTMTQFTTEKGTVSNFAVYLAKTAIQKV